MSRLIPVDDADLFRGLFVFTIPPFGKIVPKQTFHYPENCNEDLGPELMGQLPKFVFPYPEKSGVAIRRQEFTFAFTDAGGFYVFGYCLQEAPATPASEAECLCLVSQRPYGRLFNRILSICGDIWYRNRKSAPEQIADLLGRVNTHYALGLTPLSATFSYKAEGASGKTYAVQCHENTSPLGYADPVVGDPYVVMLLKTLGHHNLLALFASTLFERRIIVVSDDLGVATGCVLGMERLCHPISWEGVFIPIMPNHLLDYCTAPMPFLVGVHSSNWKVVERMPLDDVVIVHADEDKVITPFNDVHDLPSELFGNLKDEFKSVKKTRNSIPDKQFATALSSVITKLCGNFREHVRRKPKDGSVEVDWESLAASKPKGYARTMELLGASQSLRSMLDRKITQLSTRNTSDESKDATVKKPAQDTSQKVRRKTFGQASHGVLKKFMATRPDLTSQPARVHVAVLLGSTRVSERTSSHAATSELVDHVLHPEYNSAPCSSLIVITSETVLILEDKSGKVLHELATDSILYCKPLSSENGMSNKAPLLIIVTTDVGFARQGYVFATKTEKHGSEAAHSLSSVCRYLPSSLGALPPLEEKEEPHGDEPQTTALVKRTFGVHFVDKFRVDDEADITFAWIKKTLASSQESANEHLLAASCENISVLDLVTMRVVHQNTTASVCRVLYHEWPVVPVAPKQTGGNVRHVTASSMRMSDADRMDIMLKVKEGKMTTEEATKHMMETEEKLKDNCVCIVWKDEALGTVECLVVVCTDGLDVAKQICNDIGVLKSIASKKCNDPFVPTATNNHDPKLADVLRSHELDRNNLSAVQLFRAGRMGNQFLANLTITPESLKSDCKTKSSPPPVAPDWMKLRKKYISKNDLTEVPVAVKLVSGGAAITNFFIEKTRLHIDLKHENIVAVAGVCFAHHSLLRVCEFMQYGDLQTLLVTCKAKGFELTLREQTFMIQQLADALGYLHNTQRVVHNSICCQHALVSEQCQVKLSGFNEAKKYEIDKSYCCRTTEMALDYFYTAPESIPETLFTTRNIEPPSTLTTRLSEMTDTWQFGVTMWEILNYGATPYSEALAAGTTLNVMRRIANKELRLTPPDGCNPMIAKLMESCIHNEPKQRPSFKKASVLLDRTRPSFPPHEKLRDVGHVVCPHRRSVFAKASAEIVHARRSSLEALKLASGGDRSTNSNISNSNPNSPATNPDADDATSPKPSFATDKKYFAMQDWKLDSTNNLVRVQQPEIAQTGNSEVQTNPFANDVTMDNGAEWNPFMDSPPSVDEPNKFMTQEPKPTNPFATNPFATPSPPPTITASVPSSNRSGGSKASKGKNPYSDPANPFDK